MESKDLIIIILGVIVVILAIIAVSSLLGGDENLDDANDTNVSDDNGNITINIITDGKKVKNITPVKNETKAYVVDRYWSDQHESYISVYSNGSSLIEKTGAWLEDIC